MKAGWGQEYSPIFSPHKNYHIDFSKLCSSTKPLLEVSDRVIKEISVNYEPPYNLMVSGGVDSQAMLWCWKNSSIPFSAVSFKLTDSNGNIFNNHDFETLVSFAENNNIDITFVDFDIINFLSNHLLSYATKYTCTSPQITAHMAMSEKIKLGTKILSGNFIPGGLYNYTIMGMDRYAKLSGHSVIPYFFMFDSELAGNLIQYEKNLNFKAPMTYERKVSLLKAAGIPILPQETKYTGFEKIKDYYDINSSVHYKDRLKYSSFPSKRNFDILFRYKLADIIRYEDKIIYKFPELAKSK